MRKKSFDDKCLYLSLRFAGLHYDYILHRFLSSSKGHYKEFDTEIVSFLTLARFAHENIVQRIPDQLNQLGSKEFRENSFLSLIGVFLRERKEYKRLLDLFKDPPVLGFLRLTKKRKPEESNSRNVNALVDKLVSVYDVIVHLEKIFLAVRVNDWHTFEHSVNILLRDEDVFRNPDSFNPHLAAFIYRQVFELKLMYGLERDPTDVYELQYLHKLTHKNLFLFTDEEISNVALRLEINTLIMQFQAKEYEIICQSLSVIRPTKKLNLYASYYPDIILMELIALIETYKNYDPGTEKLLRYYTDYTKKAKSPLPEFHKKADGFIRKYQLANSMEERKEVCQKYLPKIEPLRDSFNPFHLLFVNWMKSKG